MTASGRCSGTAASLSRRRRFQEWLLPGPESAFGPPEPIARRAGAERRPSLRDEVRRRAAGAARMLRDVFYGFTGYEFERHAARARADLENLFTFMIMGDLLGVPVLPPYYALRLVPYLVESVPVWRRRVLRERQPFESEDYDLHGV